MLFIKACSVFVLYLATTDSQIISTLDRNIKNHVKIKTPKNGNTIEVMIETDDGKNPSLFLPSVKNEKLQQLDKFDTFYTALSCSIGYLTMISIYEFVKWSPLLYHYKYLDYTYREEFRPKFKSYFNQFLKTVGEETNRFIGILNNMLNAKSDSSYYRDTSLLEALLSLQIKTRLGSTSEQPEDTRSSHYDTLRLVLSDMNKIQRSLLTNNCSPVVPNDTNPRFYDQYIEMDLTKQTEIRNFLEACAKNVVLEVASTCSHSQMLLEDFITLPPTDHLSKDIADASIVITSEKEGALNELTMKEIHDRIKISRDSETVFWFTDSVLAAIVKIIFREVLTDAKEDDPPVTDIADELESIKNIISADDTSLPEYLVDGFTLLYRYEISKNSKLDEIQHFYDSSLEMINLKIKTDETDERPQLKTILKKLVGSVDSLKCFQESYKVLRDNHNKYYIPFMSNKKALFLDGVVEDDDHSRRVCDFAKNVYSTCFLAIMFLQNIDDPFYNEIEGNEKFHTRLYKVLKTIQHYFLLIIKKGSDNVDILKMAYNIVPILINTLRKSNDQIKVETREILRKVMAEMNNVGIRYCAASSKNNFLLFNQINFHELGNKELVDKAMENFYQFGVRNFDKSDLNVSSIDPSDYNYLSVEYLHTNFIKDYVVVKVHENTINVYWYGQMSGIQGIYQNTDSSLVKPYDVYALHDMYFKFYIVAFYYEIKLVLLSTTSLSQINNKLMNIAKECKLQYIMFPRELHSFVSDINKLLEISVNSTPENRKLSKGEKKKVKVQLKEQLKELETKIDKQLVKFNIVIFMPNKICQYFTDKCCFSSADTFTQVCKELYENVINFNENFGKIIKGQ